MNTDMSTHVSRIVTVFLFVLVSTVPRAAFLRASDPPQATKLSEVIDQECDAFLKQMMREEHFTGVALVKKSDTIVHAKGYGKATEGTANSVDTVFHAGSITKQFTAAAILQLVEAGKIDLETSINKYLPSKYRSDRWNEVNCSHLLSHSSGIEDYAVEREYYDVVDGFCLGNTVDGMIREAMKKETLFTPGSKWKYSNIGFTLLGEILENQTSLPYGEYVQKRILQPLDMDSSRVHVIGHVPTNMEASGYRWDDKLGKHIKDDIVSLPVTAPDGGLTTTLLDFIKWTEVYAGAKPAVVSKASLERMTTRKIFTGYKDVRGGKRGYGYGLYVGDSLLSHNGWIVGFRSHFILDTKTNLLVVVFTSNNPTRVARGLFRIADSRFNNK